MRTRVGSSAGVFDLGGKRRVRGDRWKRRMPLTKRSESNKGHKDL